MPFFNFIFLGFLSYLYISIYIHILTINSISNSTFPSWCLTFSLIKLSVQFVKYCLRSCGEENFSRRFARNLLPSKLLQKEHITEYRFYWYVYSDWFLCFINELYFILTINVQDFLSVLLETCPRAVWILNPYRIKGHPDWRVSCSSFFRMNTGRDYQLASWIVSCERRVL